MGFGAGLADVRPADGGEVRADGDVGAPRDYPARKVRLQGVGKVVEEVWCGGSGLGAGSLMPLEGIRRGRRSAARLRVLLSVAWGPRTRSEVRCGRSCGGVAEDVEPADGGRWVVVG